MRGIELKSAPVQAGVTKLKMLPYKEMPVERLAHRDKDTIFLTQGDEARFYPLLGGEQFLYTIPSRTEWSRHLFFGGTDESPFLVELEISALEPLFAGERAFFEGLKPPFIRQHEARWGTRAKRQGDFFAVPRSSKTGWGGFFTGSLGNSKAEVTLVKQTQLRGTRHRFTGLLASIGSGNQTTLVGEGVIEAPDHEPLELEGPHVIEQAVYLLRPKEAD